MDPGETCRESLIGLHLDVARGISVITISFVFLGQWYTQTSDVPGGNSCSRTSQDRILSIGTEVHEKLLSTESAGDPDPAIGIRLVLDEVTVFRHYRYCFLIARRTANRPSVGRISHRPTYATEGRGRR